jgi:protoporphyrinogen oxidase
MALVIIGAGPTGIGAALRCMDKGYDNYVVLDSSSKAGGLATSIVDDKGFTWDMGGHVIFSHYQYFDDALSTISGWNVHQRESWVLVGTTWVPYPFQNNIHRLPKDEQASCLEGLLDVYKVTHEKKAANFEEYIARQFGEGIANIFMLPYNFKVWAVPPRLMSTEWMGERVANVDLKRVCRNVVKNTDDVGWGPNATFSFPKTGGTGGIWTTLASHIPADKVKLDAQVVRIDTTEKCVILQTGEKVKYSKIFSTMPLDDMLRSVDVLSTNPKWNEVADSLVFSSSHIIGIGLRGSPPEHLKTMCWMYFPDSNTPFYRATVFSNYAAANAPDGCWSLMLEVSESKAHKPVNVQTIVDESVAGCIAAGLITAEDVIVSRWHHVLYKGYPTPFVGRNEILNVAHEELAKYDILSRGRFGGWKYEVGNQDHSMMQGVEGIDLLVDGTPEVTYPTPDVANAKKDSTRVCSLPARLKQ